MAAVASAPVVAGVDGTRMAGGDPIRSRARRSAGAQSDAGARLSRSAALNPLLPIVDPRASGQATLAVAHAAYAPTLNAGSCGRPESTSFRSR